MGGLRNKDGKGFHPLNWHFPLRIPNREKRLLQPLWRNGQWPVVLHLLFLLAVPFSARGQAWLPVNRFYRQETEAYFLHTHVSVFTPLNPIPASVIRDTLFRPDSLLGLPGKQPYKRWIVRKLFQENLAVVKKDGLVLKVNGLADFSAGKENNSSRLLYRNTRGALFEGTISGIIGFSSALYENQARFPSYLTAYIQNHQVLPGQGVAKKFHSDGYDFSWSEGNVWVRPWKNLYVEAGFGKRFFGDGYRSLLLSDFSHVYPYAGYRWYGKRFFLAASTQSLIQHEPVIRWDKRRFPAKTSVFHFAGAQLGRFQITLMEANMYDNPDTAGNFHWQAVLFNPAPLLNSLAGGGNTLWGLNVKFTASPVVEMYAQLAVNDYPVNDPFHINSVKNKTGFQAGVKWLKAFALDDFFLQAEYNQVRPYTYCAGTPSLTFTHYNEPLAHPLGANFREGLVIATWRRKFLLLEGQASYAVQGRNEGNVDQGSNPLLRNGILPEKVALTGESHLLQGIKTEVVNAFAGISWIINPVNTLHLSVEYYYRMESAAGNKNTTGFFMIGLRTNRINHYYDF